MQKLTASVSPRHFLVPLPPGISAESDELFGFYVYELRVGHNAGGLRRKAVSGPPSGPTVCSTRHRF